MSTRTKDTPDAAVWTEGGRTFYLCARCLVTDEVKGRSARDGGYRAAIAHLWRAHSIRRVWINDQQPERSAAAQLAFDLAVTHNRHF